MSDEKKDDNVITTRLRQVKKDFPNYTILFAAGHLVQSAQTPKGTILLDSDALPILRADEISDDETVNIFLETIGENSGIIPSESLENCWEILRNRTA